MELKPGKTLDKGLFTEVLIVPYGIETSNNDATESDSFGVNCTLWN